MAEKATSFDLTVLERNWVKRALEVLRGTLVRSRGKEIVGSEVYDMRGRELAAVDALLARL